MERKGRILLGSLCITITLLFVPFLGICATSSHPTVSINVLASKMGATAYVSTFAMADIINKNHPWLRATATETQGATENVMLMIQDPERKKNTIFFSTAPVNLMAQQGLKPFQKPYNGMRGIARFEAVGWFFITLDPNIKTPRDFQGKRVELGPRGSSIEFLPEMILKNGWGITPDKVKYSYAPPGPAAGHLSDKLVDVAFTTANIPPPKYNPIPAVVEVMASKKVYFIGLGKEGIESSIKATGYNSLQRAITHVPAQSYGPTQPSDIDTLTEYLGWYADAEMDEEIVYELTKTIYENMSKFGDYHAIGKGVTKDTIGALHIEDKEWHPGAVKFYKEKNVEIK